MGPEENKQPTKGESFKHYSPRIKEAVLKMMLPPENMGVTEVHEILGIPTSTLKKWRARWRAKGEMEPRNNVKAADKWSSDSKFAVVMETIKLSEIDLVKYCLKNGLSSEQVRKWQDNCLRANADIRTDISELLLKEKKKEQELDRIKKSMKKTEAELAEARALLNLRKKVEAIWGTSKTEKEEE